MPTHKTMRITGGSLVRRRFLIPELVDENVVRPTPDRVRESVFSIIQDYFRNAQVLDLFAGSGAHGFEAISRGASAITFVEKNPQIAQVIRQNIVDLGLSSHCTIVLNDVQKYVLQEPQLRAKVIFVDPPYTLVLDEHFFVALLRHLNDEGIVVFRCFKKEKINVGPEYLIEKDRTYGGTRVLILRRALT